MTPDPRLRLETHSAMTPVSPSSFRCRRCGNCCRHPGEVRLRDGELTAIAACLGIDERDAAGRYARLRGDRRGLVLKETSDGACIFLEGPPYACRVQDAKPLQCREFPFSWRYEDLEAICPATPPGSQTPLALENPGAECKRSTP